MKMWIYLLGACSHDPLVSALGLVMVFCNGLPGIGKLARFLVPDMISFMSNGAYAQLDIRWLPPICGQHLLNLYAFTVILVTVVTLDAAAEWACFTPTPWQLA